MYNFKFLIFKLLVFIFFLNSCNKETIVYDEIDNQNNTIQTSTLPIINSKIFQSFPSNIANNKLYFGNVKNSENKYSLIQMTLFSGNIPPVSLIDLLADSIIVDSAMVFFQSSDSLDVDFDLSLYSVLADNDTVFSDSLNSYTANDFMDFEANSFLLDTINLNSESFIPDSTGLDTVKFIFSNDNENLDNLKEYFFDTNTYPGRTFMLKNSDNSLNQLYSIESHESSKGAKMRVWYKVIENEQTVLDTFLTFFSNKDIGVFSPPEIIEEDFNYLTINSGSGLRSVIEIDLSSLDISRNKIFKNSNLIFDVVNSNLYEDDQFFVIVSALQDSVNNWNFTSPFTEGEESDLLENYQIDGNYIFARVIENNKVKIPLQLFLQGYKNGIFTNNELMIYSSPVNSPFDKVSLNLNAIEVMYVEP